MFSLSPSDVMTDTIWEDIRAHLERFERKTGAISAETIRHGAANSDLQIWGLQDAERVHGIAVTQLSESPRGVRCVIHVACGDVPKPIQERMLDEIGKWAKVMGAYQVRSIGRRGWIRRFPRFKPSRDVIAEWNL